MKPLVIGISGAHSGVGKTTAVCRLLERLPGWGAVKYTGTRSRTRLVEDREILGREGKDTALMLAHGAARVLWVEAPRSSLPEMIGPIRMRMADLPGFLVEGNSLVTLIQPDVTIFVGDGDNIKKGADELLLSADLTLYYTSPPPPSGRKDVCFHLDDTRFEDYVLKFIEPIATREKRKDH